jgi:hypothetical protein
MRTLLRSMAGVAVLTSIAASATACSSSSGPSPAPGVASLATTTTTAAPSAGSTAETRPRLRLDMTAAEQEAVYQRYFTCMRDHGADTAKAKAKQAADQRTRKTGKESAADKVCYAQYYPQQPWEEDPSNPDSRKFFQLTVQCLKDKGVRYVDSGTDGHALELGGKDNDAESIRLGLQYADGCERQAAQQLK